jgi:hypothetical protein
MRVAGHQTLYANPRYHAAFPSVAALPEGALAVAFRRARDPRWLLDAGTPAHGFGLSHFDPRSHICVLRLDAATLRPLGELEVVPPDPDCAEQDASLLQHSSGELLLGTFGYYPVPAATTSLLVPTMISGLSDFRSPVHLTMLMLWGPSVRRSRDGGRTFGPHAYLPAPEDGHDRYAARRGACRGGLRGQLVELDGELLLAIYDNVRGVSAMRVLVSADGGASFAHRALVFDPDVAVSLQEPSLLGTPSGTLVAFCRTAGLDDRLVTVRSQDGGRTWSPLRVQALRGHPAHPLRLRDGRVLLSYGYRHPPFGIRARLLDPEAESIDDAEELVVRDDGAGTDLGYPWAVELPDGDVLVTYYWCDDQDLRTIVATRLTGL